MKAGNHNVATIIAIDRSEPDDLVADALRTLGWHVESVARDPTGSRTISYGPALVLLGADLLSDVGPNLIDAIRRGGTRWASVPILALVTTPLPARVLRARSLDGFLLDPPTPADLRHTAQLWRPGDEIAVIERLGRQFGEPAIAALLIRLRKTLRDAVAGLDGEVSRADAHRVAGVAGTLGFSAVSDAWLAVSEGNASAIDLARATARRAIASIDRLGHGSTAPIE